MKEKTMEEMYDEALRLVKYSIENKFSHGSLAVATAAALTAKAVQMDPLEGLKLIAETANTIKALAFSYVMIVVEHDIDSITGLLTFLKNKEAEKHE
jgi:hypothetical protein